MTLLFAYSPATGAFTRNRVADDEAEALAAHWRAQGIEVAVYRWSGHEPEALTEARPSGVLPIATHLHVRPASRSEAS